MEPIFYSLEDALRNPDKVTRLDLSNQGLSYFPEEICRLLNLQSLILSGNQIKEIPESIGNLKQLKQLKLNENLLQELPESI
ncbi:MAG: leucine-rich repeat domain-containing protein, partial [Bacteroidia bacterium]|nr:leucine-rich repeat domain-containing protein [Bacteroidia bacterium]